MSLDHGTDFVKQQTLTKDAFLDGRLVVQQPASGFRAGIESVLLGAAVNPQALELLDLGCGAGVASLVALSWFAGLRAVLADRETDAHALAAANLRDNGFAGRGRAILANALGAGPEREAAGLARESFDSVIANPPFFDSARGTLARDEGRAHSRHEEAGALDAWVRAAVTCVKPGGEVIFIHMASALPALLSAFTARLGAIHVLPLASRHGDPARRILIRGIKGSKTPMTLLAAKTLHGDGRAFTAEAEAIFRGHDRLHW